MKLVPVNFNLPVTITKGQSGLYFATSPLMKGLLACGDTEEEALRDVTDMLPKLSEAAMSVSAALSPQEIADALKSIREYLTNTEEWELVDGWEPRPEAALVSLETIAAAIQQQAREIERQR